MRVAPGPAIAAVVVLGPVAEAAGPGLEDPRLWIPDLLVGWTLLITGVLAWWLRRAQPVAALLMATGIAWFAGFIPETLYWHRGPLVHLLLAFPGWRPRTTLATVAVAVGYLAAVVPAMWASTVGAVTLSVGLVVVAAHQARVAPPVDRPASRTGLVGAVMLAAALLLATLLPTVVGLNAVLPSLLAYEAVVAAVAVLMLAHLPHGSPQAVTDAVVDLADQPDGSLRRRLASALADPTVEMGIWSPTTRDFRTDDGRAVDPGTPGPGRSTVAVTREGRPFAVLEHDEQSLRDPRLVEAVDRAVRLFDTNAALRERVDSVFWQIYESRRRLVLAADEERQHLDERLQQGPARLLTRLDRALDQLDRADDEALTRAREHAAEAMADLHRLSNGLRPRDLDGGLLAAATAATDRLPMAARVESDGMPTGLPADTEQTAYFVVAESLANVVKYAHAHEVLVRLDHASGWLRVSVSDDGVGGAAATGGTGLQGLSDRVAAVGGTLEVRSPKGAGTTVVATIPVAEA